MLVSPAPGTATAGKRQTLTSHSTIRSYFLDPTLRVLVQLLPSRTLSTVTEWVHLLTEAFPISCLKKRTSHFVSTMRCDCRCSRIAALCFCSVTKLPCSTTGHISSFCLLWTFQNKAVYRANKQSIADGLRQCGSMWVGRD